MSHDLEERLARLEAIEEIRQLKHRYLAACDAKQPHAVRDCFADGPVHIDYGPVGRFDSADALVKLFTDLGCHPHIVEMHHGSNPQIALTGPTQAKASWSLHYQQINTQTNVLTQLGAVYADEYVKTPAGWKIRSTVCTMPSTLVLQLGDAAVQALVKGRAAA